MAVSDADRRVIHEGLVRTMGADAADMFMEHLPHAGWPEFATKQDLAVFDAHLRREMADLKSELRGEISKQTRTIVVSIAVMTLTLVGSFSGLVASISR